MRIAYGCRVHQLATVLNAPQKANIAEWHVLLLHINIVGYTILIETIYFLDQISATHRERSHNTFHRIRMIFVF